MPSPCRKSTLLLLFLSVSPTLNSHLFAHAASTAPPVTRPRIKYMTVAGFDDYDYDYSDNQNTPDVISTMKAPTFFQEPELCKYNPCLENQQSCESLYLETGCLCPGISGLDMVPHPPIIQSLLPVTKGGDRGKVEVQWCAPSSVVSAYRVVVEGQGDTLDFADSRRRGLVGSLEVGTKVCVEAVNAAGHSKPSEFSCKRYDLPQSSDHNLFAWVLGGGIALLVLLILTALIIWRFKMYKKAKRDSSDGLGNPSYSTEGTL